MTGKEILEKYPNSKKLMLEWIGTNMKYDSSKKDISEEFKKYIEENMFSLLETTIDNNPRNLFTFFDQNNLIINTPLISFDNISFKYTINNDYYDSTLYENRILSEKAAIMQSIILLEENLNKKIN